MECKKVQWGDKKFFPIKLILTGDVKRIEIVWLQLRVAVIYNKVKEKEFEKKLDSLTGRKTGFEVPDNYFNAVFENIKSNLPAYREPEIPRLSKWQRVKPYVYLAAMFAGIWCMMKMFHVMTESVPADLNNPPEFVAMAMTNQSLADEILSDVDENAVDFELEETVVDKYNDIEDFQIDFNESDE